MKVRTLAGIFSLTLCSSAAFGWNIDGHVVNESGTALEGVAISSFNYPSISGTSDATGYFSISNDGSEGILPLQTNSTLSVHFQGRHLQIDGVNATDFTISLIDALGKVTFQKNFKNYAGSIQLDLSSWLSQKTDFLRISANGSNQIYLLSERGVLRKDGDPMATLAFAKDGYEMGTHTMAAESESDVIITLKKSNGSSSSSNEASSSSFSSSSEEVLPSSSSEEVSLSSSSSAENVKPATVLSPGKYNRTIDGRKYILYVPNTYDGTKAVPMIVDYHPIMGSADGWSNSATYEAETKNDAVIIIYPDGATGPMGQAWNVGPCCTTADDITFSRDFIEAAKKEVYVDTKRIYATGFSMGGGMSNYVACMMADLYAAVAPASFDLAKEIVDAGKCNPARAIPVLNFRGTNDNIVNYNGGYSNLVSGMPITFMGAVNNLKEWAKLNGCTGTPTQGVPEAGCQMYESCTANVKVGLCTDKLGTSCTGTGHEAGCARIGWAFLKQFTMP